MDSSRLSIDGSGFIERMPLLSHTQGRSHQRHVSIDKAPSSSLGSFQFLGLAEETSFSHGSSPSAPPGFTPIIVPWPVASHQSSQQPSVTGGPIKDAGRDTTLHHHELLNHGSLQPLTLHSLLASPPSPPQASSPLVLPPAASAPVDVGGSQKSGNLYALAMKGKAATSHASSSTQDKAQLQRSGLDSLEQAFLTSKDTPPYEQLLGPSHGKAAAGTDLQSILSNLPRHLKVNIPQQPQQNTISILQAAGQQQRSSQSQTVYNDMVTVAATQPIAAQRKAGSSSAQAAMRASYKAIQEMKINKVKMPPLASQAPVATPRASIEGDAPSREVSAALDAPVGSLSHSFFKLGPEPAAAWIGEMVPAASIGDCPFEVGSFRVFLLRIDEVSSAKSSEGSSLNPRTWTGMRSKLVLRACLKEDVEGISGRLMAELSATAASKGLDRETCQRISVVPLGQGVVEPSGGKGKRVFLSITSDQEDEGKPSKVDPKASQAVDVPLVMETLLRTALPNGFVVHHVHLASPAHSPPRNSLDMADRYTYDI